MYFLNQPLRLQSFDLYNINDWLTGAYIAIAAIQLLYFWLLFSRFALAKPVIPAGDPVPVSVVLSAKNEYPSLKRNLPLILEQDYSDYEVVVVNDASDDETIFLLEDLSRQHKNLKVVTITQDLNFFKGKKFPLAIGIKSATYDNLVLTDADCTPAGRGWLRAMAAGFSGGKDVVLGYGKYFEEKGFLNRIIRYETAFTALQYFSMAMWGMPYMGVGRNLAYRKRLFMESKGFISHYNVSSGDDDLFINKVATGKNTFVQFTPESFTRSAPKRTFRNWWLQKRRHLTTGRYYKLKHKVILGSYSLSYLLFLLLFVVLLVFRISLLPVLILFIVRVLSQLAILYLTYKKLQEKKLLLISPLIELLLALVYPVLVFSNLVYKESKWK